MPKYKKWDDFKIHCSSISRVMSKPLKNLCADLNKTQKAKKATILAKGADITPEEVQFLSDMEERYERYVRPILSESAKSFLASRYSVEKYGTRRAAASPMGVAIMKGSYLENKGLEMLSEYHGVPYERQEDAIENEYLRGKCDGLFRVGNKLVEVKTPWSTDTFMPNQYKKLSSKFWMQMQGYLNLYGMDHGQICYVLVNTPQHLIEQHAGNIFKRYAFGEISTERYEDECLKMEAFFNYDRIPMKRRVISFDVVRSEHFMSNLKAKIEKCRVWLNEFEKIHVNNRNILTLEEDYIFGTSEEDNVESNPADTDS